MQDDFLADHRQAIAQELDAALTGVTVLDYTAEVIDPPAALVVPSQPYVVWPSEDSTLAFSTVRVDLDVLLLVTRDGGQASAAAIDQLLVRALRVLNDEDNPYDVARVLQPGVVTVAGAKYLGAVITIRTTTREP